MASRFWVPAAVTGAVSGTGGVGRLTVPSSNGFVESETVTVSGITGATGCNVTTTIHVVDSTHIELNGTTFGGVYVSGGVVAGANWTASNTANWASTTGGSGGQTVPGVADSATFDGSSGGGVVTVNTNFGITSLTLSAFTGTLDFSANNNNPTLSGGGITITQAATATINFGSGTFTLNASNTAISFVTVSGLTCIAGSATFSLTSTTPSLRSITLNGQTLGTLIVAAIPLTSAVGATTLTGPGTIDSLTVNAPNYIDISGGTTVTLGSVTVSGASSSNITAFETSGITQTATISAPSGTLSFPWSYLRGLTFSGGATFTAPNSLAVTGVTGITVTPPNFSRIVSG